MLVAHWCFFFFYNFQLSIVNGEIKIRIYVIQTTKQLWIPIWLHVFRFSFIFATAYKFQCNWNTIPSGASSSSLSLRSELSAIFVRRKNWKDRQWSNGENGWQKSEWKITFSLSFWSHTCLSTKYFVQMGCESSTRALRKIQHTTTTSANSTALKRRVSLPPSIRYFFLYQNVCN